jgi:hypothetical protein
MKIDLPGREPAGTRAAARVLASVLFLASASTGCGDSKEYELAPVSGTITLDGAPAANVEVAFQPIGGADDPTPGPSSLASADDQGRFTLTTVRDEPGAVVGNHRVLITTPRPARESANDTDVGPPFKELIPAQYNINTTLTREVPADGTTEANFELTSTP